MYQSSIDVKSRQFTFIYLSIYYVSKLYKFRFENFLNVFVIIYLNDILMYF
jgi:hypothetical protein